MTARATILLALCATATSAGMSSAADLGPIYAGMIASAPELRPVEIGTGWYLRGDVGYEIEADYDGALAFTDRFGEPGRPFDTLRLSDTVTFGGGIGYRFTEYLRGDVTARYGSQDVSGSTGLAGGLCGAGTACDYSLAGDARSWELMANAYADLGTFAGFTPYVGGGVGAVNLSYDLSAAGCVGPAAAADCAFDGADSWRFAYNLGAGVAYTINRSLALDVGYRYLNVEGDRIGSGGTGRTIHADDDGYDRHTITAGLRYSLW